MKTDGSAPELLEYAVGSGLRAFSTTRFGGCGKGSYGEFNITHYCGDDAGCVSENRRRLCAELGIDDNRLLLPHQTHNDRILPVDAGFMTLSREEQSREMEGVDALLTDLTGVCIGISTADCVPVLLYAADGRAVGAVHAGWRGTVAAITLKAVKTMEERYGVPPAEIHAVIGPCISEEAFEVGDEVYDAFSATGLFDMDAVAHRRPAGGGEKWHIDLRAANVLLLERGGVLFENVMVADVCTYGNADRFFSARRLGINSGRIFTGIMRRP